jgi:hypothetical protein
MRVYVHEESKNRHRIYHAFFAKTPHHEKERRKRTATKNQKQPPAPVLKRTPPIKPLPILKKKTKRPTSLREHTRPSYNLSHTQPKPESITIVPQKIERLKH